MSLATLTVDLIAQTASFNANIEKAAANLNSQTARMNRSVDQLNRKLDSARSAAMAFRDTFLTYQAGRVIGEALDYAASLGEVSQQLGVTTKDLQVYRYIATQVGVAQEDMEKGLAKLTLSLGQASLGSDKQGKAFAALGVSVRDANGHVRTAGQVIPEIADKLAGVSDPAQRAAIEVALFGKAGQKLDTVLTEGRQGIDDYAKAAEEAGMVIGDDVAKAADEAADKIAALTTQLKVNFSREVAENANSIIGLANALQSATLAGINFVTNYPKLAAALAGAAVGARFGGAPGAAVGAGLGFLGGMKAEQAANKANMDLGFRREKLADARRILDGAKRAAGSPAYYAPHLRAYNEQVGLYNQAVRASRAPKPVVAPPVPDGADLPDFLRSGGGGGSGRKGGGRSASRDAERAREEAIRREKAFQDELANLNGDLLDAKRDNVTDQDQLAQMARDEVKNQAEKLKLDIEAKVKLGDYTRAQADQLTSLVDQVAAQKVLTINTERAQEQSEDLLRIQMAANDNQRDILQVAESLARTAGERRDISLRLLDLDQQEERAKLEAVLATKDATAAEKQIAQARLAMLDQIYSGRRAQVLERTQGPLENYADGLRLSPEQINERVQQLTVDELNAVHDGITNAITSAIGVNDPIISGMISLLVDQLLIRPITEALLKAQSAGGGGIGGLLGGLGSLLGGGGGFSASLSNSMTSSALASIPKPVLPFANGTTGAPGGWSIVGERGPELLNLPTGAQVTPAPRTAAMLKQMQFTPRNDNGWQGSAHFHFPNVTSAREARESGDQAARAFRRRVNGPVRSNG